MSKPAVRPAPNGARSAKGARTRSRLLDAAKVVFENDGFQSARITDIANTAGTSHGSFYHYFDSKEQIFREVAAEQEVSLLTIAVDRDHPITDPVERIRQGNRDYLAKYRREARIMRVIEEVSRYDVEVQRIRVRRQREFGRGLAASIERMQVTGLVDKSINPALAASILGGMVNKVAEMFFVQKYEQVRLDELVDQVTMLWASALGLKGNS